MRHIVDLLTVHGVGLEPIVITDIGAMTIGVEENWQDLVDRGLATVLGFEPQQEEWARCQALNKPNHRYVREAVGDGKVWPFHRCALTANSSVFEPNIEFVSQFVGLVDLFNIVETTSVETQRLDDIAEANDTDFLKLDVQGAELMILQNATETLRHVSIVQTEVCFGPLYKGQPLFSDIDQFLREQGFMFHTFLGFGQRSVQPLACDQDPYAAFRQMLWSDAVYMKPFGLSSKGPKPSTLLKRAVLFHSLYQSFDVAARALHDYDRLTRQGLADAYAAALSDPQAA